MSQTVSTAPERAESLRPRRPRRSASLESLATSKTAETFTGLPHGVRHPDQLIDTLKAAAPALRVPKTVLALIDHLMSRTQPRDWNRDTRPIAWPSNLELMSSLGLKPTAVSDAIRFAVKHGFLIAKDSPTGKRYGRRQPDGSIDVERSFGFDLTPLSMRHAELTAIATRHRADHTARMAAKKRPPQGWWARAASSVSILVRMAFNSSRRASFSFFSS